MGAAIRQAGKNDVDMTSGSIVRHLIRFSLPLLAGNLFQQFYNTVDTWVVGNYVSNEAFSAVGTVGPITTLLVGFFMGLASGSGVVISQYYGAKQYDRVQDAVHTCLLMTMLLGLVFTVAGMFLSPYMLRLMRTPETVMPEALSYLRIIYSGVSGLMLYNMGAGVLRAVGDSKRPFYFLVVCALLNIALDLLFVPVLHMGVEGVAYATILSQLVSAVLVLTVLKRSQSCVQLHFRRLRLHGSILKKIVRVGIPAALQMSITSFSNIFVQSYINFFGDDVMAGWTAYVKVDQLLFLPMMSIAMAATTFVGQNLGCNQVERAKKGVRRALVIALITTLISMVPILLFASPVVAFFNPKPAVIRWGTLLLRWLTPFYLLSCFNQVYTGALRGSGNAKMPMIIMLTSFVAFRQVYLFAMSRICNEVIPIGMSFPAGWLLCSILTGLYYHKAQLGRSRLVDDN